MGTALLAKVEVCVAGGLAIVVDDVLDRDRERQERVEQKRRQLLLAADRSQLAGRDLEDLQTWISGVPSDCKEPVSSKYAWTPRTRRAWGVS